MWRTFVAIAVLLSFPSGGHASDFWDEVRSPGLRAHAALLREVSVALRREEGTHAMALIDRAAEAYRARADTLVLRGLALGLVGEHARAVEVFGLALATDPMALDDPQWGTKAALIATRVGRFDVAAAVLTRVIGHMPSLPARRELFALLGDVLLALGPEQLERSIVAYREALRGSATADTRSLLGLALALNRHDETAAASEVSARLTAASRSDVVVATLPLPASEKSARLALTAEVVGDLEAASTHWQLTASEVGPWQAHAAAALSRVQQLKPARARTKP